MDNNYKLVKKENPYELDYMEKNSKKVVALTKKNSTFIEAVVKLDSNYRKESEVVEPHKEFNPETYDDDSKNLYCGSMKYWFNKINEGRGNFETNVLGAIIAIDRSNSTHLQASENGRKEMRDIICKKCKNVNDLKTELEKSLEEEDHLLNLMSKPIKAKGRNGKRSNLSFASKFCSVAAENLKCQKRYSKYDGVVATALPIYSEVYLNIEYKKGYFSTSDCDKKISKYKEYASVIEKIIKSINNILGKNELDHIIWYTYKG